MPFLPGWQTDVSLPSQQNRSLTYFSLSSRFVHQAILSSDETTHVLENLDPFTEYDVTVTAIYPDESESEDLLGSERTCKQQAARLARIVLPALTLADVNSPWNINVIVFSMSLSSVEACVRYVIGEGSWEGSWLCVKWLRSTVTVLKKTYFFCLNCMCLHFSA